MWISFAALSCFYSRATIITLVTTQTRSIKMQFVPNEQLTVALAPICTKQATTA